MNRTKLRYFLLGGVACAALALVLDVVLVERWSFQKFHTTRSNELCVHVPGHDLCNADHPAVRR